MSEPPLPPAPSREYRTRLWMGSLMLVAVSALLAFDWWLERWLERPAAPGLFVLIVALAVLACLELYLLLDGGSRPPLWLVLSVVVAVLAANWPAQLGWTGTPPQPWRDVGWVYAAGILGGFLWEMASFREPGGCVQRLALLAWMTAYLGLLPCFLAQLRWVGAESGLAALALVIFVPKFGDIGAYFTGRFLGRHRMTPLLSPKKTWEGLAGGLTASMAVAVGLNRALGPLLGDDARAAGFGLAVGVAGVLGDLAESLIKRDCGKKDASRVVPGFGGVLDVVDSILFAAPVGYWWLC